MDFTHVGRTPSASCSWDTCPCQAQTDKPVKLECAFTCKESMCHFLGRTHGEMWLLAIPLMSDQDEPGGKGALPWNLVSFFSKYKNRTLLWLVWLRWLNVIKCTERSLV